MDNVNKSLKTIHKSTIKNVSQEAGVYTFWNQNKSPIYIGKANNLKNRLRSYFSATITGKTLQMMNEAKFLSYILVSSELEALLLEAKLIRNYKPKYNFALKDDKHPLYIRITKQEYPRILTARKINESQENMAFYGPFPNSYNVKKVLAMLRRVFPYAQHKLGKRSCLYSQIGLCNPCPNEINKIKDGNLKKDLRNEYIKNIKQTKAILDGKLQKVKRSLEGEMKIYSKREYFEKAKAVYGQIERLDYITQPIISAEKFIENPNLLEDIRSNELKDLKRVIESAFSDNLRGKSKNFPKKLKRIECFDVAHISGSHPVASMVTFVDGNPEKSLYRHFKIRQKKAKSDFDSMKEVAKRRTKYFAKWGRPDLIIVDGGKAQVSAFLDIFIKHRIPVVGSAKHSGSLIVPVVAVSKLTGLGPVKDVSYNFVSIRLRKGPSYNLVKRIQDEAHRFAGRYHHMLVKKNLLWPST